MLTAELLAVADQTLQPTRASLWLRPRANRSTAATADASGTRAGGLRSRRGLRLPWGL